MFITYNELLKDVKKFNLITIPICIFIVIFLYIYFRLINLGCFKILELITFYFLSVGIHEFLHYIVLKFSNLKIQFVFKFSQFMLGMRIIEGIIKGNTFIFSLLLPQVITLFFILVYVFTFENIYLCLSIFNLLGSMYDFFVVSKFWKFRKYKFKFYRNGIELIN